MLLEAEIYRLPALFVAPPMPPEVASLIKEILESSYIDGVDEVVSAALNGDFIEGEFIDQVGPRAQKRLRYRISENEILYKIINTGEVAQFAAPRKPLFGKGSRGGRNAKKKCVKGLPCGGSCQPLKTKAGKDTVCRSKPGGATKAKIKKAKAALGGASPSDEPGNMKPAGSISQAKARVADLEVQLAAQREITANAQSESDANAERLREEEEKLVSKARELNANLSTTSQAFLATQREAEFLAFTEARNRRDELGVQLSAVREQKYYERAPLLQSMFAEQRLERAIARERSLLSRAKTDSDYDALTAKDGLARTKKDGVIGYKERRSRDSVPNRLLSRTETDINIGDIAKSGALRKEVITDLGEKGFISYSLSPVSLSKSHLSTASRSAVDFLDKEWNGAMLDVSWKASFDLTRGEENRLKGALAARRAWGDIVEKIPPGTLLVNSPVGGQGRTRDMAYQKQGFGRTDPPGKQYAMVGNNGQLIPIELSDIKDYDRKND